MKLKLCFTKMEGCGNDYILIDCVNGVLPADPQRLSVLLSDRHRGIGADGLVLLCPSQTADVCMHMFNADGSEGRVCGNALRCVCEHIYNRKTVENFPLAIETLAGIRWVKKLPDGRFSAEMGRAEFTPEKIPVLLGGEKIIGREVLLAGEKRRITCVSVGNPHCVLFTEDTQHAPVLALGAEIERDPLFPERVNVEFVQVLDRHTLRMRVWERGSGETLACGTGACAAAVAAVENGYCDEEAEITVLLPGGVLQVWQREGNITLIGEAREVFSGEIYVENDDPSGSPF